jgi:hypothetical protein
VCDSIGARQSSPQQLRTELGIFFPRARQSYEEGGTSGFRVGGSGFVEFTESFKYSGSIIHYSLSANAGVGKRIKPASTVFGASSSIFSNRHIDYRVNGRGYVALCLSLLLCGCEAWCLKEKQLCLLCSFHNRCARSMHRITWLTLLAAVFVRANSSHALAKSSH